MENIIQTDYTDVKIFDLKGSVYHRTSKDGKILKDNDFIEHGYKINITKSEKLQVLSNIKQDVKLLSSMNVMDYSLLLGIYEGKGNRLLNEYQD